MEPSPQEHDYSLGRLIYVGLLRLLISNMCMHAEVDKHDDHHIHANLKLKKAITIKPNTRIKLGMHHYLFYDKIFKTKSHLPMFARYFKKIFFNTK